MRVGVMFLAVGVFLAALIFNTEALIRLPVACLTGGCGPYAGRVAGAAAAGLAVVLAVAVLARRPRGRPRPGRAAAKRKPGRQGKPKAARASAKPPDLTPARPERTGGKR
jgi:hypothetical protein